MKRQAIHNLLDLARRLPSIEILNTAELTPLLEAARAIKAAEGDLKEACAWELEDEELACRLQGRRPPTEKARPPELSRHPFIYSF
jgi:hypothetical protein